MQSATTIFFTLSKCVYVCVTGARFQYYIFDYFQRCFFFLNELNERTNKLIKIHRNITKNNNNTKGISTTYIFEESEQLNRKTI